MSNGDMYNKHKLHKVVKNNPHNKIPLPEYLFYHKNYIEMGTKIMGRLFSYYLL